MKLLLRALLSLGFDLLKFLLFLASAVIMGLLAHLSPLWFWSIVGVVVLVLFIVMRMVKLEDEDKVRKHRQ
jgi:cell division protein FtsW (lipid II flippase)